MAKHPKKAWSQWNVEIPNQNRWFRAKGVFNMNRGKDYISYMVSPKDKWQTGFIWCISFVAKHDKKLPGGLRPDGRTWAELAGHLYLIHSYYAIWSFIYIYIYINIIPFPIPKSPEIPPITQSKPRDLVVDLVISGICEGGPWRLLRSMWCSRDWILPFGKSTLWWIQMFFFWGYHLKQNHIFPLNL